MPQQFYGLTIKEASTKRDATTKVELDHVLFTIMERHGLYHFSPHKIKCFELDQPTLKYPKGRLHIHTLLMSTRYSYYNKLKYTDLKFKNYSIVIKLLIKPFDIGNWAAYCAKDKIDKCDITVKRVQSFKKDKTKNKIIVMPCILDILNDQTDSE